MTHQSLKIRAKNARPKDFGKLDIPPASTGEALKADVLLMKDYYTGIYEAIAELAMVDTSAVYKWFERPHHRWAATDVEAVVRVTGGLHYASWIRSLGAPALKRMGSTPWEILESLSAATRQISEAMDQTARDLSPNDDTPFELDREERLALLTKVRRVRAALEAIEVKLEEQGA